jgi:predicted  nucleic acid-binding Zn-ribbon protein
MSDDQTEEKRDRSSSAGLESNKGSKGLSSAAFEGRHASIFGKIGTLVRKSGFLHKQGANWKGWRRRYFVLQGPFMTYYEEENSYSPNGVIILEGCVVETCPTSKWNKEYCFEIAHPEHKRVFILQANSEQHRESWIKSIKEGITWPTLVPELMKKYEDMENKVTKSKLELKKTQEQMDLTERQMIELQRQADDNKAVVSLFNFKMEEKDGTIKELQEEVERLKASMLRISGVGNTAEEQGKKMSSAEISVLNERVNFLEEEKVNMSKKIKELTEKYNKKRVERELLRKEVLRLKKVLGEPIPQEQTEQKESQD